MPICLTRILLSKSTATLPQQRGSQRCGEIAASKMKTCKVVAKQTVRITQDGEEVTYSHIGNGSIGFHVESGKRYVVSKVLGHKH